MTGPSAEVSEVVQNYYCFQFLALRHDQRVSHCWQRHHCRRYEDQCEDLLSSPELAILQVDFGLAFAASAEDDVVAGSFVDLDDLVAVAADFVT